MRILQTICNEKSFQSRIVDMYTSWDILCEKVKTETTIHDDSLYVYYNSIGKGFFIHYDEISSVDIGKNYIDLKGYVKIGDELIPHRVMITKIK